MAGLSALSDGGDTRMRGSATHNLAAVLWVPIMSSTPSDLLV
jgi:hypothetical protein